MFFYASKLFQVFGRPDSLVLLTLLLGVAILWSARARFGRALLTGLAAVCLVIAVVPVQYWVIRPLEAPYPPLERLPEQVDGIIAMGGLDRTMDGHLVLGEDAAVLTEFLALARGYPNAQLLFTGGSGALDRDSPREADAAAAFLASQGLDLGRLVLERNSTTTHEHALFGKELADPKPGQTWLMVTTALRARRNLAAFEAVGWRVIAYPVNHRTGIDAPSFGFDLAGNLGKLWLGMKEWIGLLAYRATGRGT